MDRYPWVKKWRSVSVNHNKDKYLEKMMRVMKKKGYLMSIYHSGWNV